MTTEAETDKVYVTHLMTVDHVRQLPFSVLERDNQRMNQREILKRTVQRHKQLPNDRIITTNNISNSLASFHYSFYFSAHASFATFIVDVLLEF